MSQHIDAQPDAVEETPALPDPRLFRFRSALEAITAWKVAQRIAAELRTEADVAHARALLAAYQDPALKNDGARKATADIAAGDALRLAELAEGDARAAGALVDLLVGRARS